MAELETYGGSHGLDDLEHKRPEVRYVVGVTCILSIVGSAFIILSYLCFHGLRSRARLILVHISIMDFGAAMANFVGVAVNFDHYFLKSGCHHHGDHDTISIENNCTLEPAVHRACVAQAVFAHYFTNGSFLWTICLSFYLYFLIVHHGTERGRYFLYFSHVFCYLMPLFITLWLLLTHKFGYAPYNSAGWCSLIGIDPITGKRNTFVTVVGYDLWIVLAFTLVPLLSLTVHYYIRQELDKSRSLFSSERVWTALHSVDYKFLLIPVAFIILRIWSFLGDCLFQYGKLKVKRMPDAVMRILINFEGIGDSGQGFANGILFVLFTKKVREQFLACFCCRKRECLTSASLKESRHLLTSKKKQRIQPLEKTPTQVSC